MMRKEGRGETWLPLPVRITSVVRAHVGAAAFGVPVICGGLCCFAQAGQLKEPRMAYSWKALRAIPIGRPFQGEHILCPLLLRNVLPLGGELKLNRPVEF